MNKYQNQDNAFHFLLEKYKTQGPFSKEDFFEGSGWDKKSTFDTYWSKQFKTLLVASEKDPTSFRVSEAFRRFSDLHSFRSHVTQNRSVVSDYTSFRYDSVTVFEFFMPLTNEGHLRQSLDSLFYKDSIERKLRTISPSKLEKYFPKPPSQSEQDYTTEIAEFISEKFGGYSILHVSGRFRADRLKTFKEASEDGEFTRYLVDETTAVVRFIFPCGESKNQKFDLFEDFDSEGDENNDLKLESSKVRFLFYSLFVKSIVEMINGEDEIWMLESGLSSRLHVWRLNTIS